MNYAHWQAEKLQLSIFVAMHKLMKTRNNAVTIKAEK
jgi:hypothetical protein